MLIGLILSFLFSAYFSVVKIIFSSVDRSALPADNERLRFYASKIEDILESRTLLNTTVSFGKTVSNVSASILLFGYIGALTPARGFWNALGMSVLIGTPSLSLFAYAIPRAFALRFFGSFVSLAFLTYNVLSVIIYPFAMLIIGVHRLFLRMLRYDERFAFLSDEEKMRMRETGDEEQGLDENEREMIHSIFELGETTVREIMVPRVDIKGLEVSANLQKVLDTIKEIGHSRIPVYRDNIDSIVGILYARDVLTWIADHNGSGEWNLTALLKKPHFVPVGKMIDDLMSDFKKKQIHLAMVVDEYGGTAGIVTLEDILEEIVGEIQDEYDVEEAQLVQISANVWHVNPHMDLHDLCQEIEIDLELEDVEFNTLGGLIYHEYGDVPLVDTEIEYDGLRLRVLDMDGQRIEKVRVEIIRDTKNGAAEEAKSA
jgi:CBS domain containing-hemolysin-like protein